MSSDDFENAFIRNFVVVASVPLSAIGVCVCIYALIYFPGTDYERKKLFGIMVLMFIWTIYSHRLCKRKNLYDISSWGK